MSRDFRANLQRWRLHFAAKDENITVVDELIKKGYPLNRFDDIGQTPLHYAVERGDLGIIDRLIRAGADVNAHDEKLIGNTPLGDNAEKCSYEVAKKLVDAGADPTIPGWMQLTALDRAKRRKDASARSIVGHMERAAKRFQKVLG